VRTRAADGDRYPAIGRSIPFEGEPTNAPEGLLRLDLRLEMGKKTGLGVMGRRSRHHVRQNG